MPVTGLSHASMKTSNPSSRSLIRFRRASFRRLNMALRKIASISQAPLRLARWAARRTFPANFRSNIVSSLRMSAYKGNSARRYLRSDENLTASFKALNEAGIRYTILRWFQDLPEVADGEDIDILVADADLQKLDRFLTHVPGTQPVDVYSVSGLRGSDYRNVPYFPPRIAQSIVDNRVRFREHFYVPDPKHYLLSLVYHVVFHKAELSGLPFTGRDSEAKPDHDYGEAIWAAANASHQTSRLLNTFEDLVNLLRDENWLPELDTLRILARNSSWLKELLPKGPSIDDGEFMIFIIRAWALEHNKLSTIIDMLQTRNLDVMLVHELSSEEAKMATSHIRGGKWDRGPYPVDGGTPAAIIACFDYHPSEPSETTRRLYPHIRNEHVLIKHNIRDSLNSESLLFWHTNCIHSADDEMEAWLYAEKAAPKFVPTLRDAVAKRRSAYHTGCPVLKTFDSNRTRSKIELIDLHGDLAIKKTFRIGMERYAQREAIACERMSRLLDTVPPLLEKSSNFVIIPWYENVLDNLSEDEKAIVLRRHAREIVQSMKVFFEQNLALIGFYPGNLLVTSDDRLIIVDFEFLYEYEDRPDNFLKSYDIVGIPDGFDGDTPRGLPRGGHTYRNTWYPLLGELSQWL